MRNNPDQIEGKKETQFSSKDDVKIFIFIKH